MAEKNEKTYLVTNRSASRVHYAVPEIGVKSRDFQPGESKKLKYEEILGLSYIPGGLELIRDYLKVESLEKQDEEIKSIVGKTEPEYNMDSKAVRDLILTGSMDEWLDALDFAPEGVIDLIKTLSTELPLTDTKKMQAFKEKKKVDLASMIQIRQEELAEERAAQVDTTPTRRTAVAADTSEAAPARRTSGSKYKVVSKGE